MEGLWMARISSSFRRRCLQRRARLTAKPILALDVPLLDGCEKSSPTAPWVLLNLPIDVVIGLPDLVKAQTSIDSSDLPAS
jgi:hypothetical protein